MQKCKFIWMPIGACMAMAALLTSTSSQANIPDPMPLSGLNVEDFQSPGDKKQDWNSNPFVKYGDNSQARQMKLFGIVYSAKKARALINSEVVKVGDKIGSNEVVAIERQKVILRNEDGLYQITMKGTPNEKS